MLVDLIIVLIIALSTFIGYKRGLIKVAIKILSFFIAIILAITLANPVTNLIVEKTTIDDKIENTITQKIIPETKNENKNENSEVKLEERVASMLKVDAKGTVKGIAHEISIKIIKVAALLIIFLSTKLILLILSLFTDAIAEIPVIKQFNKAGGTIYGLLKGILIVCVIFAIIYVAAPLIDISIVEKINSSIIGSFIYSNNFLTNIFR